ncbi:hypothetical protein HanXRQr2_Chr04g0154371 [Helianthus annuus]|uniref:Uncharacterized protein n=1 Tax=Helianthus annuus TaxID=4232 RepID=A0A251UX38_HELAN|nr:uncharacterized protein LOC110936313 [Helianthus annuus]XP_022034366.1 uncharacterized protein LOC110936313 [Helianthus annuus]KAF5809204.1 hypothetical protein HanXRQr2_Chr04g0154371 [Helianthus annuus]KAJ0587708.1 hypothetical protein HanIR_Chr04g0166271 [Helianthus annuus]
MTLRGCSSSHFIWCIKDGEVINVPNMDSHGRPSPNFKKLEELYQHTDADYTSVHLAERETRESNSYVEEHESNVPSKENTFEELTLSQIKKKLKRKKRKSLKSILLTAKTEVDDFDLAEPLCKIRAKVSKSPQSKRVSANGNPPSSNMAQLVTSELSKDFVTVKVKVEAPDVDYFESGYDLKREKSESFTNEGETCEFNEAFCDMEMDDEETIADVSQPLSVLSSPANDYLHKDPALKSTDASQSQFYIQLTPEQASDVSAAQNSELTTDDDDHDVVVVSMEVKPPVSEEDEKCELNESFFDSLDDIENMEMDNEEETIANVNQSPSVQQAVQDSSSRIDDERNEDVGSMEAKSPVSKENIDLTSMNSDADSVSFNSDNISLVSDDVSIHRELISTVPANADSEVKLDNNDKPSVVSDTSEIRQTERLPLTRKFISPNSQEKLCQAMKSAESLDEIDNFKCKEKLYFGEQAENKLSPTKSDVNDNELNSHLQQATQLIQNKAVISSKQVLKRPRNFKKGSPTKKGVAAKGCLDGPRLCRSLPRLSSGCTSIEGCSESAIAFSQRQMHDIESLASKLMSELNSMKTIVEEKMLYEAYRSASLKNEADEVKSVIKSATKTEETAKKWLSMMARDCNRFCKIMKLNEDHKTSASGDPALGNSIPEKPLEREKKKISFADEAGGTLCDIKVYEIEQVEQESFLP